MLAFPLRIGTRASPLALKQADLVCAALHAAYGFDERALRICPFQTEGDRLQDRPLSESGGKGLFTKELDQALYAGKIDLAVHSAKDVATAQTPELLVAAFLPREDVRDAFLSPHATQLLDLPEGAVLGTASLRRQALARRLRPDLKMRLLRGNVQTRLRKLEEGEVDAIILAFAGLKRLQKEELVGSLLDEERFPPAPAQGALCIQIRAEDTEIAALLAPLSHQETALCVTAERAVLAELEGSCRTPIAALARCVGTEIALRALLLSPDGYLCYTVVATAPSVHAAHLGKEVGCSLKEKAGPDFFKKLESQCEI